jgi:lipid-binding SYLF domain-containing protein
MKLFVRFLFAIVMLGLTSGLLPLSTAAAASSTEIDIKVDAALAQFKKDITGGAEFLSKAKGVLVFPDVVKGGFIVGGEYGQGALRIDGKSVDYYSIASASFGFQIGGQQYGIVMVFLEDEALTKFRESKGWEAGVDASVAVAEWGAGKDINTANFKDPVVGFVISSKGLMAGVSLEGSKISKLEK